MSNNSTPDELKKAYFTLAKKYHPDSNRSDTSTAEKFKEVTAAYEVLKDQNQRAAYDAMGHAGVDGSMGGFGGGGRQQYSGGSDPFENFFKQTQGAGGPQNMGQQEYFDVFEQFFGGRGGRFQRGGGGFAKPTRGNDLQMVVYIPFLDAVKGCKQDVGIDYVTQDTSGKNKRVSRTVNVTFPAGVDSGTTLRVPEQGMDAVEPNLPRGHLYLVVEVLPDPYFHRDGSDVHVDLHIPVATSVLGGKVEVVTLDGMADLYIPAGTQPGTTLAMRGKGISSGDGGRGAQYVHIKVDLPSNPVGKVKQVYEDLKKLEDARPATQDRSKAEAAKRIEAFKARTKK